MRSTIYIFFLLLLIIGCSKYASSDCSPSSSCNPVEIDSGYVYINLSYTGSGAGIPVILYEGYVEDQNIIWADTVYESELTFWLENGKRYAAEAYYNYGGQLTVALDGRKLKQKSYQDCGQTCYQESSITLDVKKL
ncbi:MAG: hypothetical protein H6600_02470 [Flavobacteriales bacterium]|nr:hypothetical protein [Flavobacteriales bacterium]